MADHSEMLRALPDIHRWVEARALLIEGSCDVFGYLAAPQLSAIVRDADAETLFVIGAPGASVVEAALRQSPLAREVIGPNDQMPLLRSLLPQWSHSTIIVHRLRDAGRLPHVPAAVRVLDPAVLRELQIDAELKQELEEASEQSSISSAFVDGSPVAFCYAGAVTESLWDIALDTVEAHRRKGYAGVCVAHRVRLMREQRKEPVWQAALDNPPSWRLAEKLGFEPVDELAFLRRAD